MSHNLRGGYGEVYVAGSPVWGMAFDGFLAVRCSITGSIICLFGGGRHARPLKCQLRGVHGQRVRIARPASPVFSDRRAPEPPDLSLLRTGRDLGVHRHKLMLHALHENSVPFINAAGH